jgi:hypothetical protein
MKIKKNNQSSDDLAGDILEGYLDPIELCEDAEEGKKVAKAIELVKEFMASLEEAIEVC